ncbi:hypothetical protein FJ692_12605 [Pseudomonas fluorescens]|nr:hypothetical protein FJ692_12605 [Pseudomonas fluorescens]
MMHLSRQLRARCFLPTGCDPPMETGSYRTSSSHSSFIKTISRRFDLYRVIDAVCELFRQISAGTARM